MEIKYYETPFMEVIETEYQEVITSSIPGEGEMNPGGPGGIGGVTTY